MKKLIATLLTCTAAISLAACGRSSTSSTTAAPEAATSAEKADTGIVTQNKTAEGETYTLKFALQNNESHPLCQGVAKFGDILEEKSGGRIKLELYYSGTLGDKASTVQGMQTGTIDAAMLMSGVIADYGCDDLGVFTLPYLFDSVKHARTFEKSDAGKALLDTVQSSGSSMVCIGAYQESARNYFFTKKRVEKPSDMKNMQIRCQEGSIYYDSVEALGAFAQSVAFSELYSALQSGVVDGADQPLSGFVNNAFQEVSDYYVMDQHEISPNLILFSEVTWNRLSSEDQQLIKECFQESVPYFEELSDAKDKEYLQTIKDSGTEVIDVNVAEWQAACASVYDKYGQAYSPFQEEYMGQAKEINKQQKNGLDKVADGISTGMLILCMLVFAVMVFAVSYGVVGRYLPFVRNPRWTQELGILCMVWLCFLSAGFAIKEGLHVRMSLINYLVPGKLVSFLHGCAYGLLLIVNMIWIIYGVQLMKLTKMAKMSATRWPMSIIYMSVVIGGLYGAAMSVYRLLKGGF